MHIYPKSETRFYKRAKYIYGYYTCNFIGHNEAVIKEYLISYETIFLRLRLDAFGPNGVCKGTNQIHIPVSHCLIF